MLVLFETPAGYSLFQVSDEKKLSKTSEDDIHETFFSSAKRVNKYLQLLSFQPFQDTADAVSAATACMEGKVSKTLSSFLKKKTKKLGGDKKATLNLAISDKSMANGLKESIPNVSVVHDGKTQELFRGIREHMEDLLTATSGGDDGEDDEGLTSKDLKAMQLGLSHSLSRYKLKFSADKVDTMIIQAIGLLDELDKEINTYAMRVKEWYGWHFPELQGLVSDNIQYSKCVTQCGIRANYHNQDLSSIFEDESQAAQIKETAELSMGTEIAEIDILHIQQLADQVLNMTEYRAQLYEYIKNRMNAIAPNLTILVGELVGARLIAHSGSLMNLAKQPASTVQILGAEKALFRALKTKHNTPKYGLIYHASLIGQASAKNKGKISRVLAAKASLAIRVDALTDDTGGGAAGEDGGEEDIDTTVGFEGRAKVEARLRQLEGGSSSDGLFNPQGTLTSSKISKYDPVVAKISSKGQGHNDSSDMVMDIAPSKEARLETPSKDKKKKDKKEKKKRKSMEEESGSISEPKSSSKKKKRKLEENGDVNDNEDDSAAKKAAKKAKKEAKKAKKEKRKSKE